MDCIYRKYCKLHKTAECGTHCTRYKLMQYMLDTSRIPKKCQRFQEMTIPEVDKKAYENLSKACANIKKYVDNGTNFVLYSEKPGNGKTSWAIKLMIAYFNAIWDVSGAKPHGYYLHLPTYLHQLKEAMSHPSEELTELDKNLIDIDLLIIDDIGATTLSDFDVTHLTYIIDQRWINQKSTIYTTNRNRESLAKVVGERMTDRIWDSVRIHFNSSSFRGIL